MRLIRVQSCVIKRHPSWRHKISQEVKVLIDDRGCVRVQQMWLPGFCNVAGFLGDGMIKSHKEAKRPNKGWGKERYNEIIS